MSFILNIETATEVCSICVAHNSNVISARSSASQNHASDVHIFIQQVLKEAGITAQQLSAVAVTGGPGSYTGLRIGWATAKGLCYALNIPLIAVDTLQALAYGLRQALPGQYNYMPMIDARRLEVYTAVYDNHLNTLLPIQPLIFSAGMEWPIEGDLIYGGTSAQKAKPYMPESAIYIDGLAASSENMVPLSYLKLQNKQFEDLAYSEPNYLKGANVTEKRVK